jgi:EpsI family protein
MPKRAIVLVLFFVLASAVLAYAAHGTLAPSRERLGTLSMNIGGWQGRAGEPFDARIVQILGVDDYVNRVYARGQSRLRLYIGYYAAQKQGASIHSPMNCLPGAGWFPVEQSRIALPDSGTHDGAVINRVLIENGAERQVVLYWYQSQGRVVASEYVSKLYLFMDAVRSGRTDAALIRVMSPVTSAVSERPATEAAAEFSAALLPLLDPHVPR